MQTQPVITIYEPERRGDRWLARATINARGERIELTATASDRLAQRARGMYNRAADWVGDWIQYRGSGRPGAGVFGDLPVVAHQLAHSETAIVDHPDTANAAALFAGCCSGDAHCLAQAANIMTAATSDPAAAAALEQLHVVQALQEGRGAINLADVFVGVQRGDHAARQLLAALRHTRPPEPCPVRLTWHQEDYMHDAERLPSDVEDAASDEIGARIVRPHGRTIRRVRPSLHSPMLRTFQQLASAYS